MFVNLQLTEELFQHIWGLRLFNQNNLTTTTGEAVKIISPGTLNLHDGPDFQAARVRIGDTLWAGNVELHLRTSDWFRHGHQSNPQYQQVILHVVFMHDLPPGKALEIPCLELQQHIPKVLLQRYEQLRQLAPFVPCGPGIERVPELTWTSWKDRLLAERWERKTENFKAWLLCNQYNWEEVCYWALSQSYGAPVNAMPFLQLAQSLPFTLLLRYRNNLLHLEALLFGQAGMLTGPLTDEYALTLQRLYQHLRHKHGLVPLPVHIWNWMRIRPAAFPSIRLAALAAFLQQTPRAFAKILDAESLDDLAGLFNTCPSPYWHTHYRFNQATAQTQLPGLQMVHNLIINTALPLLMLYGQVKHKKYYQQKAIDLLQQLPPEKNTVLDNWKKLGAKVHNALDSQALLQLKRYYCEEKKCLKCAVGIRILSEGLQEPAKKGK